MCANGPSTSHPLRRLPVEYTYLAKQASDEGQATNTLVCDISALVLVLLVVAKNLSNNRKLVDDVVVLRFRLIALVLFYRLVLVFLSCIQTVKGPIDTYNDGKPLKDVLVLC